jgi:hypothetical protein
MEANLLVLFNVTDLFGKGMNEDLFGELTKDESNPRPENCEG